MKAADSSPPRSWAFSAWCITAAFGTYFCMYAFRKPFTVGTFTGESLWGVDFKTVLVTSQTLGYMLSKFLGIKIIAEMTPERRAVGILTLIGIAEASLLLFALIPPPFNLVCMFINGMPLGMVFGLVLGYLEGRQVTEALMAGLCASFIVSTGAVKDVGLVLLEFGISEYWMPFLAGLVFVAPLLAFVAMLSRIPPPTRADVAERRERAPMTRADRRRFFWSWALGLTLLVVFYLLVTILRSIRDDFAVEILRELGHDLKPSDFTWSETLVMLGVTAVTGSAVLIRDNRTAFFTALAISLAGMMLVGAATAGVLHGAVSPFTFMVLVGVGVYVPYVAVHTTLFERLMSLVRDRGNLGYLMYLADAFGYLGYVVVMLGRGYLPARQGFLDFFLATCWVLALASMALLAAAWIYFARRTQSPATHHVP